jgi:hypothetical protein
MVLGPELMQVKIAATPHPVCDIAAERVFFTVYLNEEAGLGEMLHAAHGVVRYLVLLAGLAAAVMAVAGWNRAESVGASGERTAMTVFVGLVDVQLLLGLLLLLSWPYYPALVGHIVLMVLAAAVAHGGSLLARRRGAERSGSPVRLAAVVLALVLMVGGIMAIQRPVL